MTSLYGVLKNEKNEKTDFQIFFPFSCFVFGFCTGQNQKNAFGHNTKQRVKNTDFLNGVFKNEKNEKTNFQIFFPFSWFGFGFCTGQKRKNELGHYGLHSWV